MAKDNEKSIPQYEVEQNGPAAGVDADTGLPITENPETGVRQGTAASANVQYSDVSLQQFLDNEMKSNRNMFLLHASRGEHGAINFSVRPARGEGQSLDFAMDKSGSVSNQTVLGPL